MALYVGGTQWPSRCSTPALRCGALPRTTPKLRRRAAAARAHGPTTLRRVRPARVGGRERRPWARHEVRLVEGVPEQQER